MLLTGCSSNEALVKHQVTAEFSDINSYSFFERNSFFTEQQNINDTLRNSLELAIEKSFDAHGYVYQEPLLADIIIAYQLTGIALENTLSPLENMGMCTVCIPKDKNKKPTQPEKPIKGRLPKNKNEQIAKIRQHQKNKREDNIGDLVLNFINVKTKKSLWRSEYPLNIKEKDNSQEIQIKIENAITEMMKLFPTNKAQGI